MQFATAVAIANLKDVAARVEQGTATANDVIWLRSLAEALEETVNG